MSDLRQSGSINFRVQRHGRRDLRAMRPVLWVSLAIGFVSFLLAIVQTYETIDLRSRLKFMEMQVKAAEARAADLATKNKKLIEELTQANALNENLRKRPQAPLKAPARKATSRLRRR
jgi:biopolymer transport protein ExbB/TolQ